MKVTITGNFKEVENWLDPSKIKESAIKTCETLCDRIGKPIAEGLYQSAQYDGTNDVKVETEPIKDGYSIVASGKAALFIEFGTGVYYNGSEAYPDPEGRPRGVVGIGEFGDGHGKQRSWGYPAENGVGTRGRLIPDRDVVITHGNPPAAAMYYARLNMADKAQQIFNEEVSKNER